MVKITPPMSSRAAAAFGIAAICAAALAVLLSGPTPPGHAAGPSAGPPLLAVYLMDEPTPTQQEPGDPEAPTVLQASTIVVDPAVLDQIDPHLTEIDEMPIVRVELFSDLVVDAEFLSGRLVAFENDGGTESQVFVRNRGALGDLNGDGCVGEEDKDILHLHWGYDCSIADLTGDGNVGSDDLVALLANWDDCEE